MSYEVFHFERVDFINCWKALQHSERIFQDSIDRGEFPEGSNKNELEGFLTQIRNTKSKIESLLFKVNQEES